MRHWYNASCLETHGGAERKINEGTGDATPEKFHEPFAATSV